MLKKILISRRPPVGAAFAPPTDRRRSLEKLQSFVEHGDARYEGEIRMVNKITEKSGAHLNQRTLDGIGAFRDSAIHRAHVVNDLCIEDQRGTAPN